MHIIGALFMILSLTEAYTMVNYYAQRECRKGNTAQCSNLAQRVCCKTKEKKFRSTKFTGIAAGDICAVWDAPGCDKVNESKANTRCVSQTQTGTTAKLGGSSVYRLTKGTGRRAEVERCESSQDVDQVNMDGYSYKVNYNVPQNVSDEIFNHAIWDTPRAELPLRIQMLGVPTQYDHEGTPLDIASL